MRATIMYGAGDVQVVDVPDAAVQRSTDAVVRILRACICGNDLHPYHNLTSSAEGKSMGQEFLGVVEDIGRDVSTVKPGDVVIGPFAWSDNTCDSCLKGSATSCRHGGFGR